MIENCDAEHPSVYFGLDGIMTCRCLICARCEKHAPSMYGHYTGWCRNVSPDWNDGVVKHHFCCPNDCELK